MKSLKNFQPVVNALAKIAGEATVSNNNGTQGREMICHYWSVEDVYDKERQEIETAMARIQFGQSKTALYRGKSCTMAELVLLRDDLPQAKRNMIFKLLEPIPILNGTKVIKVGDKTYSPKMHNVEFIYIAEDAVELELVEYEETTDMQSDKMGHESPVIKMRLKSGIIDVSEQMTNWKNEVVRESRAWVTALSYRSMQVVGRLMGREESDRRKADSFNIL